MSDDLYRFIFTCSALSYCAADKMCNVCMISANKVCPFIALCGCLMYQASFRVLSLLS